MTNLVRKLRERRRMRNRQTLPRDHPPVKVGHCQPLDNRSRIYCAFSSLAKNHMPFTQASPRLFLSPFLVTVSAVCAFADGPEEYVADVAPASEDGARAIERFQFADGLEVDIVAAEPLLANPVAFTIDERGRFYVAETFRLHRGVTDARRHMYWLDDDLACRRVEDRVAMYRKWLGERFDTYAEHPDRVRLLTDTDGDGRLDDSRVFATGFDGHASGLGSGVLSRRGDVYYACIPDLWLLRDDDGDGRAERRKSLHQGYGVHVGFLGHDLHGLIFGPDGKLYFSIGDRGLNIELGDSRLEYPDTGSVLRCNPDGSDLEVFAYGLRNPQELAFDDHGNLFTGDNNSDGGDQARWVYLVEGGDSGWRIGFQFLTSPMPRGIWNSEKMWHPRWDGQAAHIVPPIVNIADGPSGLVYYPGVGLPDRYRGHFFLADFRGTSVKSGIRSFAVEEDGATFRLVDAHQFLWSACVTDVEFGHDGALYFSDWVEGWALTGKGRIYRLRDPKGMRDPAIAEAVQLHREGFGRLENERLVALLGHADRRVRQEAQFTLAERGGDDGIAALRRVAHSAGARLPRLHAIWGLGQIGRRNWRALDALEGLFAVDDAEVRAQVAKVAGDARHAEFRGALLQGLRDPAPRVRFFCAQALGRIGDADDVVPLLDLLRKNADRDALIRHAAVHALERIGVTDGLLAGSEDASPSVRLGVLLALRRLASPWVAAFLEDDSETLVAEAARAIHDTPISSEMPALARLLSRRSLLGGPFADVVLRRALAANLRLRSSAHAARVARFAADEAVPERLRIEALEMLATWAEPSGRDRIVGLWRPMPRVEVDRVAAGVRPRIGELLSSRAEAVRTQAATLAGALGLRRAAPQLRQIVLDRDLGSKLRTQALASLGALADGDLARVVGRVLDDGTPELRALGRQLLAELDPVEAVARLRAVLAEGSIVEQQSSYATLAGIAGEAADGVFVDALARLRSGEIPAATVLDLLEAAERRRSPRVREALDAWRAGARSEDPAANYAECRVGGDAAKGRAIFFERAEVSCQRCHKVGESGGAVGPELTRIGAEKDREYLLRSLVDVNAQIAEGFQSAVLVLTDGSLITGVLRKETAEEYQLVQADGTPSTVPRARVLQHTKGVSAMPQDIVEKLTRRELRDLVEYLATRRGQDADGKSGHGGAIDSAE